jgi:hypothetical protein
MSATKINLTDLTESAVTRKRGTDAVEALVKRIEGLDHAIVIIELSGFPMISASFIDEIVLSIHRITEGMGLDFIFLVRDDSILEKLARASGLREIPLKYQWQDDPKVCDVKPVNPTSVEVNETHTFPTNFLEAAG